MGACVYHHHNYLRSSTEMAYAKRSNAGEIIYSLKRYVTLLIQFSNTGLWPVWLNVFFSFDCFLQVSSFELNCCILLICHAASPCILPSSPCLPPGTWYWPSCSSSYTLHRQSGRWRGGRRWWGCRTRGCWTQTHPAKIGHGHCIIIGNIYHKIVSPIHSRHLTGVGGG